MPATRTIELSTPIDLYGNGAEIVRTLTLKEPQGGMYLDLGEPRILARAAAGTVFWFEDKEAIKAYLDRCLDHPQGSALFRLMSLKDVRALREALFGFFSDSEQTTSEK